jgi:hypothetical protein
VSLPSCRESAPNDVETYLVFLDHERERTLVVGGRHRSVRPDISVVPSEQAHLMTGFPLSSLTSFSPSGVLTRSALATWPPRVFSGSPKSKV